MADESKIRMNLAAIRKVDPYAKYIVDISSHVAFYTFNPERNEWEKTDIEGAFFVYSRNAEPFHSIFINNRLNTNSFVEPITSQLEMQSQPPFLLYRNERSRIRGFWFYTSEECDRIGNVINNLIKEVYTIPSEAEAKHGNGDIFCLLSKAQLEYNNSHKASINTQTDDNNAQEQVATNNVLKFFASAKPTVCDAKNYIYTNTISVDQLERQQRSKSPFLHENLPTRKLSGSAEAEYKLNDKITEENKTKSLMRLLNLSNFTSNASPNLGTLGNESTAKNLLINKVDTAYFKKEDIENTQQKLVPPTMFDVPQIVTQQPLSQTQLIEAFNYLIRNDENFVKKLHEAYLKIVKN